MVEIKHILCPIDFSDASRPALDQAIVIARWYEARIIALHVHNPVFPPLPELRIASASGGTGGDDDDVTRLKEEGRAWCRAATAAGISVDVLVETGPPATRIIERAANLPADLIVMGTHGRSGFEHLVLGSVTEKVLRKAGKPVLTVPPRAQATSKLPFHRLLCPMDFSDSSLAALEFAFSLAEESDARLTMLHVLEWPWEEPPPPKLEELPPEQAFNLAEFRRYRERDAAAHLEALVPDSVRQWCTPATRVSHGKPYREILRVATADSTDLIVLGVRGRNVLDLNVFGSTTNQVVRRATCPVLTVRH